MSSFGYNLTSTQQNLNSTQPQLNTTSTQLNLTPTQTQLNSTPNQVNYNKISTSISTSTSIQPYFILKLKSTSASISTQQVIIAKIHCCDENSTLSLKFINMKIHNCDRNALYSDENFPLWWKFPILNENSSSGWKFIIAMKIHIGLPWQKRLIYCPLKRSMVIEESP